MRKSTSYILHIEDTTMGFKISFRSSVQARYVGERIHAMTNCKTWVEKIERKSSIKKKRLGRVLSPIEEEQE